MSINELFGHNANESVNHRELKGTAELTQLSGNIAADIIRTMEASIDEYRERIAKSATDSNELDAIIKELAPIAEEDLAFIKELEEPVVDGMLKSQQSKRSRSKSKTMTLDNYHTLMTAAVAEYIIRTAIGKPKTAGGFKRAGNVDFTPAQLEELAADQVKLRKEIRNIQSKKSIMKSKVDFDESSEAWQALVKAEAMLKDLRIGGRSSVIEVDTTKEKLNDMLADIDIEHLKAADAKELLDAIRESIK